MNGTSRMWECRSLPAAYSISLASGWMKSSVSSDDVGHPLANPQPLRRGQTQPTRRALRRLGR